MDRLYALEVFEDISPMATHDKSDGAVITFVVKEKPVVVSINFKGNRQVRNAPLREAIRTKVNEIFVETKAIADERAIRNVYLEKGFTDVRVSYKTERTEEGVVITYNIKEGRTSEDILFECLINWGLPLSLPYCVENINGAEIIIYNDGDLIACFEENISEKVIEEIAKREPLRAVFCDSKFKDSPSKINLKERFKLISPNTSVKII